MQIQSTTKLGQDEKSSNILKDQEARRPKWMPKTVAEKYEARDNWKDTKAKFMKGLNTL